jgi:hypothetical protein
MKRLYLSILGGIVGALHVMPSSASPPVVATSSPPSWAFNVDARQKTITLTFDRPMAAGYSAWIGQSSLAPESTFESHLSQDRRTFAIDVRLQPAKVYVLALNEENIPGVGFQTIGGLSLAPYFLVFKTAGNPTLDDTPPRVLRSMPANGMQGIDSTSFKAIIIAFDRPMTPKKHGLHLFANNQPVSLAKVPFNYSPDGLTFTLPYNFKPQTQYRLELNSVADIGFTRANRIPLWPVRIMFNTR